MKKIFFPGVLLALLFIFSCSKDEFTEEDAVNAQIRVQTELMSYQDSINQVRDSLEMIGGILQFSVSVIPVDGSVCFVDTENSKSAESKQMLSGATVSVSQHGQLLTATTDESGIAVFTDLRVGELNVSVRHEGYTSINFIAFVDLGSYDERYTTSHTTAEGAIDVVNYSGVLRHAAVMVPVFDLNEGTSNISGVLSYEADLTNSTPEFVEGKNVIAAIDVDDVAFRSNYFSSIQGGSNTDYDATIKEVAINDLVVPGITDALGVYSIDIPSSADGLPVKLFVDDFGVEQEILLDSVYCSPVLGVTNDIRTIFGTGVEASRIGYTGNEANVVFSAPTGIAGHEPIETASADAVVGESGIASIVITDGGSGYTQAPKLVINGDGEGAEVLAYITEGTVTSVEITNPGKGYTSPTVDVESFVKENAVAEPIVEYGITRIVLDKPGQGYISTPDVVITSSSGSGAAAMANMTGYVEEINVTNMGSGYVCVPHVQVERNGTNDKAEVTVAMTAFNPLYSVELNQTYINNVANWYETVPDVVITKDANGSGATAVGQLDTIGAIVKGAGIILSNTGSGYLEAPSVIISSSGSGTGAVAEAILNADGTISISVLEGGSGYDVATTTVQISAPPTGGTAPVVERVVVIFPIKGITLTNPGSGYDLIDNGSDADGDGDNYTDEPDVAINGFSVATNMVIVRPDMRIEKITVDPLNNGSEYDVANPPAVIITPKCGYGTGAIAKAVVMLKVKDIEVTNSGSGYVNVDDIEIVIVTPPDGCEAQATALDLVAADLGNGILTGVKIDSVGMGYNAPPRITLLDGSSDEVEGSVLSATVSNGALTEIVFNEVIGLDVDTYTILIETEDAGDPVTFTLGAFAQSGKLSDVIITDAGAGYEVVPTVRFIRVDGLGVAVTSSNYIEAEAEAVLVDGRVVEINITNPGTGYYYKPDVEIDVTAGIELAKGTCVIEDGFITSVVFTGANDSKGKGYEVAPTVQFSPAVPGHGTGASGVAIVEAGVITKVVMTSYGSGYNGKNTPAMEVSPTLDAVDAPSSNAKFKVYAGKSYIKDIYLGTGQRDIDCNN
jgi:hypothetical protein